MHAQYTLSSSHNALEKIALFHQRYCEINFCTTKAARLMCQKLENRLPKFKSCGAVEAK